MDEDDSLFGEAGNVDLQNWINLICIPFLMCQKKIRVEFD